MKYLHLILGMLFFLFAVVQYNDPDFYFWIPVYGAISFIAFSQAWEKPQKKLAQILTVALVIWSITFIPDFISWVNKGAPNIAGSMQAETPHIELMRELFGLIISIAATVYYARKKAI